MKILVTGSAGFIAGYVIPLLLERGHTVIGLDNYSKYGPVKRSYDDHENYKFIRGDAKDTHLLFDLLDECDQVLPLAAMIGGISYFHEFAYDLLAENERITASLFDAAITSFKRGHLKKINVISSSMVFESVDSFPTVEGTQLSCPPPLSTYGFQKLSCEYFAKGAFEQYQLPYTIIRPFNCVGVGESRAVSDVEVYDGNIKLAMSHVVPDLIQKILKGQYPLRILGNGRQIRHYTYGGDIAEGIYQCMFNPNAINEDFNISTSVSTSVLELAKIIWDKLKPNKEFKVEFSEAYSYDVQKRIPDISKSKKLLGFEALTPLNTALDEVIPWIEHEISSGRL